MSGISEDDFPATANTPGQAQSRWAREQLERWMKEREKPPVWWAIWEELRSEQVPMVGRDGELLLNERGQARTRRRWDWRKALYIAWSSLPHSLREPDTLEKLCDLLGLRSSGTIRNWRRHDPGIEERIAGLPRRMLLDHVADVYHALVQVASEPDARGFQDRRLFLELTGEYQPKGAMVVSGPDSGPVSVDLMHGLGNLSDEELDTLDRIGRRLAGGPDGEGSSAPD